jgi:GTP cyclohydrolase I
MTHITPDEWLTFEPDHRDHPMLERYDQVVAPRAKRPVNHQEVKLLVRQLLHAIGEDPSREGLVDTPRRVADMWTEFMDYDPGRIATTFESVETDQMVAVRGMRVWSLCEHHLLPFSATIACGYICRDKVLGLSKLGRIAHKHAHRLQLQERLVAGIADEIAEISGSGDVAVIAKGEHLCMSMRGVSTPHEMISSMMRGAFRTNADARSEFLRLAGMG